MGGVVSNVSDRQLITIECLQMAQCLLIFETWQPQLRHLLSTSEPMDEYSAS